MRVLAPKLRLHTSEHTPSPATHALLTPAPAPCPQHELCEEVVVGTEEEESVPLSRTGTAGARGPSTTGGLSRGIGTDTTDIIPASTRLTQVLGCARTVVMRGPRVKAGVECCGDVKAAVSPATGRMGYRGRVMNRAARLSAKAHSGQVGGRRGCVGGGGHRKGGG